MSILTDPAAIQWQVRFVRYFGALFQESYRGAGLGPGQRMQLHDQRVFAAGRLDVAATITNAIRVEDVHPPGGLRNATA